MNGLSRDICQMRKMSACQFYFTSCALLLLLTLNWRTSSGIPVRTLSSENDQSCASLYKSLLLNVEKLLKNDVFCFGITSTNAVLSKTETALSCAPPVTQESGCVVRVNSSFNERECLRNIMKDLAHYAAAFQSYLRSPLRSPEEEAALLNPTLGVIQSVRKNCSLMQNGEDSSEEDFTKIWKDDTFSNRLEMCKMMRGFYSRTITINRAMAYISSGEHKK
ncbi:interleukin-12 subunit alpha [Antennarius striatus]|uniref:interleukin-12 subunit alpha n=1 Tax=Antennarius striatus TaxID=241820 RepID=UPI0035B45869